MGLTRALASPRSPAVHVLAGAQPGQSGSLIGSSIQNGGYWQADMPSGGTDRDGQDAEFGRASGTGSLQWLCALLFSGHDRPSRMHCLDPGPVISPE
jgi:hypothetical protein